MARSIGIHELLTRPGSHPDRRRHRGSGGMKIGIGLRGRPTARGTRRPWGRVSRCPRISVSNRTRNGASRLPGSQNESIPVATR
jgi:hypothetical protein